MRIGLGGTLKYLGVVLYYRLCFGKHLALLGPKIRAVSATLGRLMPNVRGPQARVKRLHATVVPSVALSGAPVRAKSVSAARRLHKKAIQLQKAFLNKVATTYTDVAAEVACLLSGAPRRLDLLGMKTLVLHRERGRGGSRTARHRRELPTRTVPGRRGSTTERNGTAGKS